jgi:hypothetical protein
MSELRRITEDYHLDKLVHSSEAANVFRASRIPSGDTVAVKLISATDESQREAFEELASALRTLDHPRLPRILDYGFTTAGTAFLVTEFCAGLQLPPLAIAPPDRALSILLQLAVVLEAFASLGTHHGRLEAENVLLLADAGEGEDVKLLGLRCATSFPQGEGVAIDRRDLARLSCQLLGVALDETSAGLHITLPQTLAGREGSSALCTWIEKALRPSGAAPEVASGVFRAALVTASRPSSGHEMERTVLLPVAGSPERTGGDAPSTAEPPRGSNRAAVLLPFPSLNTGEEDRTVRLEDVRALAAAAAAEAAQQRREKPPVTPTPAALVRPAVPPAPIDMPATIVTPITIAPPPPVVPADQPALPAVVSPPPSPPIVAAQRTMEPGPQPPLPLPATTGSGSHSKLLIGGVILLMLALAAAVALLVRRTGTEETATPPPARPPIVRPVVQSAPPPPPAAATPTAPLVNPQIEKAEADLGTGKVADAQNDLAAITAEQQAAFSEAERNRYQQVKAALDTTTGEEVAKSLSAGLASGNVTQLSGAVAAAKAMSGLRPEVQSDLGKARRAVSLASRLKGEEKAGDLGEVLKTAIALQQALPAYPEATAARDRAASALLSRADAALDAGQYDVAQGVLDTLRTSWPDAPQLVDRLARLSGLRQHDAGLEAGLAAAIRFERSNQPVQGLQQLSKEKPVGPFVERYRVERDRLKELLAKLDAAPPEVALAAGVKLEFEKDKPAEINLKVTDDLQVKGVEAWARPQGGTYQKVSVRHDTGADYVIEVPVSVHENKPVELYVTATDLSGHEGALGTAQAPIKVKRKNWLQKLMGNGS